MLAVPASAVLPSQQGMIVWVIGSDNKVAPRAVEARPDHRADRLSRKRRCGRRADRDRRTDPHCAGRHGDHSGARPPGRPPAPRAARTPRRATSAAEPTAPRLPRTESARHEHFRAVHPPPRHDHPGHGLDCARRLLRLPPAADRRHSAHRRADDHRFGPASGRQPRYDGDLGCSPPRAPVRDHRRRHRHHLVLDRGLDQHHAASSISTARSTRPPSTCSRRSRSLPAACRRISRRRRASARSTRRIRP